MPVYNGKKLAQEKLLDIATYCIHSALKAPQITGRVELDFEIVTGEDIAPIIEGFGLLGAVAGYHAISLMSYTKALASGEPPVLLLIGGKNIRKSELAWNCGACGFKTCKDFNAYAKKIKPNVLCEANGPFCQWKAIDYSMACDWACAQAWRHNITNRIEVASGWAAKVVGYKAPLALKIASEIIDQQFGKPIPQAIEIELGRLAEIFSTADALEGLSSLGRRRPAFKGR